MKVAVRKKKRPEVGKILLFWMCLLVFGTAHAQLTLPAGVVNRYGQVTTITGNTVTLSTESGATHTWAAGDHVVLVQMTGNTSANGGKFEFATILSVSGSNLTLSPLTRAYSPTTEKVQLVWVPYDASSITVSGTITAQKWDGTTGGIVAILTPGTITLNGNVNADGAGFRYADGTNTINGSDIYYGGAGGTYFGGPGGGGGGYGTPGKKGTVTPVGAYGFADDVTDGTLNGGYGGSTASYNTSAGGGGGAGVGGAGSGGSAAPHGGGGGGGAGYAGGGPGGKGGDDGGDGGAGSVGDIGDTDGQPGTVGSGVERGGGGGGGNRYVGGGGGAGVNSATGGGFSGTNGGAGGVGSYGSIGTARGGQGGGVTPAAFNQYQYCDGSFNCPDPRIWMAGGGQNNTQGGGIVLMSANTIEANTKMISANGDAGSLLIPGYPASGGGGGGGGGLLIVNAHVLTTGPLQLCAKGGQGAQGASDAQHGGGGGGSGGGGLVWVQDPLGGIGDNTSGAPPIVPGLAFCVDGGPIAIAVTNPKTAAFTGVGGAGGSGAVQVNNPCGVFGACNTCQAGNTSPTITSTTATNTCPTATVDLATLANTGTQPTGTTLIWSSHKLPTSAGDTLSDLKVAASGTYYALYYDKTNSCYSPADSVQVTLTPCPAGVIDCAKTWIIPAPVAGIPSQIDLVVTVNVSVAGTFTPLTVSGSGMSLANGITSVTALTTGIQTFHIPLKYDGSALGTMSFTIGSAGSCTADLTKPPKKSITDIWTLECVPTVGPGLK